MAYTLRFFFLQNAVWFIILTCLVPVLFTFYIQGVLKLKKNNNSGAKRLKRTRGSGQRWSRSLSPSASPPVILLAVSWIRATQSRLSLRARTEGKHGSLGRVRRPKHLAPKRRSTVQTRECWPYWLHNHSVLSSQKTPFIPTTKIDSHDLKDFSITTNTLLWICLVNDD